MPKSNQIIYHVLIAAHTLWDGQRPCGRCMRLNKVGCMDALRLKPGRKRSKPNNEKSTIPILKSSIDIINNSNNTHACEDTYSFIPLEAGKVWLMLGDEQKIIAISDELCNWLQLPRAKLLNKTWKDIIDKRFHNPSHCQFLTMIATTPLIDCTKTFCIWSYCQKANNIMRCYKKFIISYDGISLLSIYVEVVGYYAEPIHIDQRLMVLDTSSDEMLFELLNNDSMDWYL